MKPNFALNLTHEAIVLLHRTARGWLAIGEAALDSADLPEALGYLRASALGLSPQGVTTKLVLPNSQILYTEVEVAGLDAAARRDQVATTLTGRTPYAVEDLVFDIAGDGPRVQVAVVARETLDEAEGFIEQHRFNPVSFVAIPPDGAFAGEPFFGQTQAAARILAQGERVVRDTAPVRIVTRDGGREDGAARAPRSAEAKAAQGGSASATGGKDTKPGSASAERKTPPDATTEMAAPAPVAAPETGSAPELPLDPVPDTPAVPVASPGQAQAEPAAPVLAELVAAPPDAKIEPTDEVPAVAATKADAAFGQPDETPALPPEDRPAEAGTADLPVASPARSADLPLPVAPDPSPPVVSAKLPEAPPPVAPAPSVVAAPVPQPDAAPPIPAFSSRRREEAPVADTPRLTAASLTGGTPVPASPGSSARFAAPPPLSSPAVAAPPVSPPPAAMTVAVPPPAPASPVAAPPVATPALREGVPPVPAPPPPVAPVGAALIGPVPGGDLAPLTDPPARPTSAGAALRPGGGPARPATVPPGRRPAKPQVDGKQRPGTAAAKTRAPARGKPRYLGLILTGVLLVFLMIVAAWSSVYLSQDGTVTPPQTDVAGTATPQTTTDQPAAPAPVIVSAGEATEPDPELLADIPLIEDPAGATPKPADPVAEAAAEPPAPVAETIPDPPAAPPPAAAAGDTAVALSTTSAPTGQDENFPAAVEAPPPAFDTLALPAPIAAPDAAPGSTAPPPPFGTVYQFGADGRIAAGPTGVVAPGGFWLIAARPPIIPPPRPVTVAPAEAAPAAETAPAAAEAAPGGFVTDPDAASRRPQLRPAALTRPAAAPETAQPEAGVLPVTPDAAAPQGAPAAPGDEGTSLTRNDPRYAGLRPRARSAAVLTRAAEATAATKASAAVAAASLVASAEPAVSERPPNASPLAVPLSRRPAPRPKDFSRAVAAAVAEATQPKPQVEPEPEPPPQEQAAVTPEAEPEPEVQASAAPRIPSHANVAKQATFKNAINLSKVNLIGIYGTPSSRYAMVRTSGGRFTRVKVGDRVDGGTVAAITASEVRYKKGGRMLTLEMPRG